MAHDQHDDPGLTDEQLDALLHAAGEDVLAYVHATSDPTLGLLALMVDDTAPPTGPSDTARIRHARDAVTARRNTSAFIIGLDVTRTVVLFEPVDARELARALGDSRDRTFDLARALGHEFGFGLLLAARNPDLVRKFHPGHRLLGTQLLGSALGSDFAKALTLCRVLALAHARALVLAHTLELDRARSDTLARSLAEALVDDLTSGLADVGEFADTLGRLPDLARTTVVHAPGRDLAGGNLTDTLVTRLADAFDVVHARARDLALEATARRIPDADLIRNLGLVPVSAPGPLRGSISEMLGVLDTAEERARALMSDLTAMPIDASGADLSALALDMRTLAGVVWNRYTIWPERFALAVMRKSRQIADGVFQVTVGDAREDSDLPINR